MSWTPERATKARCPFQAIALVSARGCSAALGLSRGNAWRGSYAGRITARYSPINWLICRRQALAASLLPCHSAGKSLWSALKWGGNKAKGSAAAKPGSQSHGEEHETIHVFTIASGHM